ncbi:hypothetical protein V0288_07335 [Pannus brasiliensis CCIBt3594]|uniref:Uncharacterized protein n=1 Tax=Pannus brasiliensis CCIBt3594 TaxID=1427578 RepID=A0AAW9QVE9_9CHRO
MRKNPTPTRSKENQRQTDVSALDRLRERCPVPNPYRAGDICTLLPKGNPDLRKRAGQWCVVVEVHTFSCSVATWDAVIQVKIENLREVYYSPRHREELYRLRERLYRLSKAKHDESVRNFLETLGKIDRPFLTSIEEKFLEVLENQP